MSRMRAATRAGMEGFERVELFADAEELDRRARHRAHGKRGAAARIAIGAGEDDAGELHALVEGFGDVDRVLAGEAVRHQQGFVRLAPRRLTCGDFGHQRFVDMLAAGGVEDQHVVAADAGGRDRALGDVDAALVRRRWEAWRRPPARPEFSTAPSRRGGARRARPSARASSRASAASAASLADVVVLPEPCRPTIRIGAGGAPRSSAGILRAQRFDQRVVDDLDDLLAGRDRADDVVRRWRARARLSMKSLTTGSATSASISAVRTSASASSTSASDSAPRPRKRSNTRTEARCKTVEHRNSPCP